MKKYAVIVAGGSGQRMGTAMPKQFLLLQQKPLLWYSLNTFLQAFDDMEIILVLPAENIAEGEQIIKDLNAGNRVKITAGGTARFHSVQNGLAFVSAPSVVFVHDGVRCLASKELIHRCYEQALEKGSAIPAVAATDSIRIANGTDHTVADRNHVRIIQTPQTFLSAILLPAFNTTYQDSFTDEATVVEASGQQVFLIEGEYENIKITRPADLMIAEQILASRNL
ncbi:MAG: 2-C-methyl-D-erythritol 4-phosphate cytidylyltransferase [Sediminibacterium sp.]|nr:2-C-methyl-D-erythritol 4-phosphate cytidylyltransferase [Sediminibacterium sp.]